MDRGCPDADRSLRISCLYTQGKNICYRYSTFSSQCSQHSIINSKSRFIVYIEFFGIESSVSKLNISVSSEVQVPILLYQVDGTPRQRTLIKWSVTIPKPTNGPCVPRWKSDATDLVQQWWMGRSTFWEEKKAGTGEGSSEVEVHGLHGFFFTKTKLASKGYFNNYKKHLQITQNFT